MIGLHSASCSNCMLLFRLQFIICHVRLHFAYVQRNLKPNSGNFIPNTVQFNSTERMWYLSQALKEGMWCPFYLGEGRVYIIWSYRSNEFVLFRNKRIICGRGGVRENQASMGHWGFPVMRGSLTFIIIIVGKSLTLSVIKWYCLAFCVNIFWVLW